MSERDDNPGKVGEGNPEGQSLKGFIQAKSGMPPPRPIAVPRPAPGPMAPAFPSAKSTESADEHSRVSQHSKAPSGPDEAVLRRIRESKESMRRASREFDQNEGSQPSRTSGSYYASRGLTTISEATAAQYLNRAKLLVGRYRKEAGISSLDTDDINPTDFVVWLLSLKPTIKSSSWRLYRTSVYHYLGGLPAEIDEAMRLLDNDIIENDARAGSRKNWENDEVLARQRSSHKTSAMKAKLFPKKDFDKIISYLTTVSRSKLAPVLIDWLIASVHTGLRPVEWRATSVQRFIDREGKAWVWLYVINAKATNTRGNGVVRTLDISELPTRVVGAIERMSELALGWYEEGRFDSMKSQIGQLLYLAGETLFPNRTRHYALYSCRHQFIANMKSLLDPVQVSALSGHSVTKTAVQSYGKKQSAWDTADIGPHARPIEEEVATVRRTAVFYEERMKRLVDLGLLHGNTSTEFGA